MTINKNILEQIEKIANKDTDAAAKLLTVLLEKDAQSEDLTQKTARDDRLLQQLQMETDVISMRAAAIAGIARKLRNLDEKEYLHEIKALDQYLDTLIDAAQKAKKYQKQLKMYFRKL